MIIAKYDIPTGSATKPNTGTTAVAGGGSSVDLGPINEKIAALEAKVSQLELQLSKVNSVLSGLDGRFLSKLGDRSEYAYALGSVYTDFIQSEMYDDGVGYRISGSPTAAVDDKYNLIVKDVGWGSIPFTAIQQDTATEVTSNTDSATDTLITNFSIGSTTTAGYILLDCGAILTSERCFTIISESVTYYTRERTGTVTNQTPAKDAERDGYGNYILHFGKADNVTIYVTYTFTYAFRKRGDITSGTYRLYIRGTDPVNNETDCFAASTKSTRVNASGVTVMDGQNGKRITATGLETTTDGGATWT